MSLLQRMLAAIRGDQQPGDGARRLTICPREQCECTRFALVCLECGGMILPTAAAQQHKRLPTPDPDSRRREIPRLVRLGHGGP